MQTVSVKSQVEHTTRDLVERPLFRPCSAILHLTATMPWLVSLFFLLLQHNTSLLLCTYHHFTASVERCCHHYYQQTTASFHWKLQGYFVVITSHKELLP